MLKKLPLSVSQKAKDDIKSLKKFLDIQREEGIIILLTTRINRAIRLIQEFPQLGEYRKNLKARVLAIPKTRYLLVFREEK